jgi:hypothetical protein
MGEGQGCEVGLIYNPHHEGHLFRVAFFHFVNV